MSAEDGPDTGADTLRPWLDQLGAFAGRDTLLHFTATKHGIIDLTHAHPSGLAQLLTARRTRLSTLLRDPEHFQVALKAARLLRAKIFELGSEHGIDAGYLAAGTASWRSEGAGTAGMLCAPVLLAAISLTARSGQDDYEVQLTDQARVNPALVRQLEREYGIDIDPEALASMAYGTARFDPHPVLDHLRTLTAQVRGIAVEHHLYVSTFADLAENLHDPAIAPAHPVIAALAAADAPVADGRQAGRGADGPDDGGSPAGGASGDVPAGTAVGKPRPTEHHFPAFDARDPAEEALVLDADRTQQEVLDLIRAGESLVVSAPPGTGQTQTAINAVAGLVHDGKSVLVVAERRGTLNQFVENLDEQQLGSLVLQLGANLTGAQLTDQLVRAIVRNEKAAEPQLAGLHRTLTQTRHQLIDHVQSLHNIRQRWGCSPYEAMQSLAELTSINPPPATSVRLKRSVLDSITDRADIIARLRRAAELGSFSTAATHSPWFGAKLLNRQETEEAHQLTSGLAEDLPRLHERMVTVAEYSQITLGDTFTEWGRQLDLLLEVRASLDKFTPDIFDRPVTDLISATAPASWRREHRVEMSGMNRSRLRRVAKEYVRPGVHISDLHTSLRAVQEQREVWAEYATSQRHPTVPSGLAELFAFHQQIGAQLDALNHDLACTSGGGNLEQLPYADLVARLQSLAADKQTLITLPERTLLIENMREHGLSELLDDLAAREVDVDGVGPELELAWWQSALEAMISGDDYLAMSDGESLRQLEADYRLADNAHIASGASRLRWVLARRWRHGVAAAERDATSLRTLLREGEVSLEALEAESDTLLQSLVPVWTASPLVLPAVLPAGRRFDAVVILDAESTALATVLPAIGRAGQVIAFGDGQLGAPRAFTIGVEAGAGSTRTSAVEPPPSAFDALTSVLPEQGLSVVYRSIDESLVQHLSSKFYSSRLSRLPDGHAVTGAPRALSVEYLADGTGMPTAGDDGVESVAAEVNRVVDLVLEHARGRPRSSLAVITASSRHAGRVGEAIRLQMANYPMLADFFKPGREPFRVVPLERAAGLVRDSIIFSLGFGRTPHGRALHSFGSLSEPGGRGRFVTAATRARSSLHILTCFRPEDLDPTRLSHGALDFYELIGRELGGTDPRPVKQPLTGRRATTDDPLVADLAGRLRQRGANVWHHFDNVIDIVAAIDPLDTEADWADSELPRPVAIESDGTEQYRQMSVRERSRLRPQLLERLGWRYIPLWTIEVFTDPDACARFIGRYLGLAPLSSERAAVDQARPGNNRPVEVDAPPSAATAERVPAQEPVPDTGHRPVKDIPMLPDHAEKDSAEAWGDRESDHEGWLREQRPPHWG